jgi:hypothetical protein
MKLNRMKLNKNLFTKLCIYAKCLYAEYRVDKCPYLSVFVLSVLKLCCFGEWFNAECVYAECHFVKAFMLSVSMMIVGILSESILLTVVMQNGIRLIVVAPLVTNRAGSMLTN